MKILNERLPISKSSPLKARFFDYEHFSIPCIFIRSMRLFTSRKGRANRLWANSITKFQAGDILLIGSNLPHFIKE